MSTRHPELRVLSWAAAEAYEPQGVELCISIQDPDATPARLAPGFAAVLRLAFHDVEAARAAPEDVLFAAEHAAAVLAFVAQWPGVERIVVHCHAGVSRSPAIALGLCDALGLSWSAALEGAYPYWNRWVRGVLAREAGSRGAGGSAAPED
jgi:predicted protein tyrosine phosphatase